MIMLVLIEKKMFLLIGKSIIPLIKKTVMFVMKEQICFLIRKRILFFIPKGDLMSGQEEELSCTRGGSVSRSRRNLSSLIKEKYVQMKQSIFVCSGRRS